MKRNNLRSVFFAALVCGIALTSCKNKDDHNDDTYGSGSDEELYGDNDTIENANADGYGGTNSASYRAGNNTGDTAGGSNAAQSGTTEKEPVLNGTDGNPVLGPKSPKDDGGSMGSGMGTGTTNAGNNTTEVNPRN